MGGKVKNVLRDEFLAGKTWFDWAFLAIGLLLQGLAVAVGFLSGSPEGPGLILSGFTGIIAVVLCSQGKISYHLFAFVQMVTYVLCFSIPNRLHGETIENAMYFVMTCYGVYAWWKRYKGGAGGSHVRTRTLGLGGNLAVFAVFVVGTLAYGLFLANVPVFGTLDSDPWMDSVTSVPAYIAQLLMVLGFAENWAYWFVLDVGSIILAARAGSWVMMAQFVFWTANCVYGFVNWMRFSGYKLEIKLVRSVVMGGGEA